MTSQLNNEIDYSQALNRLYELEEVPQVPGSPEHKELQQLQLLIAEYEEECSAELVNHER